MADIKVNKDQWDALSQSEQDAIVKELREAGGLKIGDSVIGDSSVAPFDENTQFGPMANPILEGLCKVACDTAAAAVVA
ncbi:MAG: hypothetical protein WAV07_17965 [Candidatus Contendobacter sp.]